MSPAISFRSSSIAQRLREFAPLAGLAIILAVFTLLDRHWGQGRFLSFDNFAILVSQSSCITIGALGMMLVIAAGGIDLSAGAVLGLSTAVAAYWLRRYGVAINEAGIKEPQFAAAIFAVCAAIAVGAACGLFNGSLVSGFRLPPFIVTLGAMAAYLGIALVICDEKTISPDRAAIPEWLRSLISFQRREDGSLSIRPPAGLWIEAIVAIVLAGVLRLTVFGRHLLALGANETAARLSGIRTARLRVAVYTIAGALFGLAGVYQFALVRNYSPKTGQGMELDIIAAVVIGGASLDGGRATVIGTLVGACLMAVIRSGCTQLNVQAPYQQIVIGSIILAAVLFDRVTGRGR